MNEKTLSKETVYRGRIIDVEVHEIENSHGRRGIREIVTHGPAVCLVIRKTDGKFIFIRQFRKAIERIAFEVCAGNCDPGESPETSALRELTEETGYVADTIRPLGSIYPSVGYCTEIIHVFYAEVSHQGQTDFDHDEHIETVELTEQEMNTKILNGEVQDAKTLASWQLWHLHVKNESE